MSEGATKGGRTGFILFGALQIEPRTRRDDAPHRVT
jgi:hypothetical protein